jgi:hypothetical protein
MTLQSAQAAWPDVHVPHHGLAPTMAVYTGTSSGDNTQREVEEQSEVELAMVRSKPNVIGLALTGCAMFQCLAYRQTLSTAQRLKTLTVTLLIEAESDSVAA